MNISIENKSEWNDIITIPVTSDDYLKNCEKALRNLSQKIEIKGFRKGMVPLGMVRKMYGTSVVADEVNKLINDRMQDYFKQNEIELLGNPLPIESDKKYEFDLNKPENMEFKFEIGRSPKFDINYNLNNLIKYNIELDEAEINKEVERIRKRLGKQINPENIQEDDFIQIQLTEIDAQSNTVEDGITTTSYLTIDEHLNTNFKQEICSKKLNETFIFKPFEQLTKSKEDIEKFILNNNENKPHSGIFNAEIQKITRTESAEMNEDFFKSVYGELCLTESDFRNKLQEENKVYLDRNAKQKFRNDIREHLLNENNITLPDDFLKRWLLATNDGKFNANDIESQYEALSRRTKWDLMITKISKENNVKVDLEDVKAHTKEQVRNYFGQYADDNRIEELVNRLISDKKHVEQTLDAVVEDKIFSYLEEKVQYSTETITLDKFNTLIKPN